ncbi:MAG: hypothetical protein K2M91_13910 [Lachnospiraceae bacterium]|nr:hypothetical protein [Lachnospiraceae bacterium]
MGLNDAKRKLSNYPVLMSGNTYTLALPLTGSQDNPDAKPMKTDKLTWKSSNTKVAAVKGNAGSFTAQLKAKMKGKTEISVTSKITKKVIARYTVTVNAVGEANGYYGEDYLHDNGMDAIHTLGTDILTLNNPLRVTLNNAERKFVAFTVPAFGDYTIKSSGSSFLVFDGGFKNILAEASSYSLLQAEKGETYYFLLNGTATMRAEGIEYIPTVMGEGTKVRPGMYITFVAPEDNRYTFTFKKENIVIEEMTQVQSLSKGERYNIIVPGAGNDEYVLEITSRKASSIAKNIDNVVNLEKESETWYAFTADETGLYTIYTKNAQNPVEAALFNSLKDIDPVVDARFAIRKLEKGETVYIRLHSEENKELILRVDQAQSIPADEEISSDPVVIEQAGGTQYITYIVPQDGNYRFTAEYEKAEDLTVTLNVQVGEDSAYVPFSDIYECENLLKGTFVIFQISANKDNTNVAIKAEKTNMTKLIADAEGKSKEVSNKISEWYIFTALTDGWYDFDYTVEQQENKEEPGTKTVVTAQIYNGSSFDKTLITSVDSDQEPFTYVEYLRAGDVRTMKLTSDKPELTKVTVTVIKEEMLLLTEEPITFTAGETKRLYWIAEEEGLYDFTATVTPEEGVSIVQCAHTPDGDDLSWISGIEELSGYMKSGEIFYLTLKGGSQEASYQVGIRKRTVISLTAGKEETIEIEAGAAQWAEFTAGKTALYAYNAEDAVGFDIYKTNSLTDADGDSISFSGYEKYYAGQRQLFRIENMNEEKKFIRLTVSEIAENALPIVTVEKAGEASVKSGKGQWFKFHAEELGRYRFEVKAVKTDGAAVSGEIDCYTENLLAENMIFVHSAVVDNMLVKGGKDIYFYVTAAESEDAADKIFITLSAAKISPETTLENDKEEEKTLTEDETTYLEFVVPEDGIYTFTAKARTPDGENTQVEGLTVGYYKNLESTLTPASTNFSLELEKEDKIIIKLTSTVTQTITVTMKKENVIELPCDKVQSIKDGDVLWYRLRSDITARYFIETFDVAEGVTLQTSFFKGSRNYTIGEPSGNGFYYTYVGESGDDVVFRVTSTGADMEKTFRIGAGSVSTEAIMAGEANDIRVSDVTPNHMVWYRFTPEKAGIYVVKAGGASNAKVRVFTENILFSIGTEYDSSELPYKTIISESDTGKELVCAVSYTGKEAKDFAFSVYKAEASELTEEQPIKVDITKIEAKEPVWIRFKAPADGRYTFVNDCQTQLTTDFYPSVDEEQTLEKAFDWGNEVCMDAGEEILFAVSYTAVLEKSFQIRVSSVKPDKLNASGEPMIIELNHDDVKWLELTAPSAAMYLFELTVQSEGEGTVTTHRYEKLNRPTGSVISNSHMFTMEENQSVYFALKPDGLAEMDTMTVSVRVFTNESGKVRLNRSSDYCATVMAPVKAETWITFIVDEEGIYDFGCETLRVSLMLYKADKKSILGAKYSGYDRVVKVWLDVGDEVCLEVTNYESDTCAVTAKPSQQWTVTKSSTRVLRGNSGEGGTVVVNRCEEVFVPLEVAYSGTYQIYIEDDIKAKYPDLTFELYIDDSEEPVVSGKTSIEYAFAASQMKSAKLKIFNGKKYASFDEIVYYRYISHFHHDYALELNKPSQAVTCAYAEEAWFSYTVQEAGMYQFYSESVPDGTILNTDKESTCAELYVKSVDADEYEVKRSKIYGSKNNNYQFVFAQYLEAGDKVSLRTYCYNHNGVNNADKVDSIQYTVTMKPGFLQEKDSGWLLDKESKQTYMSIGTGYELVIPLTFEDAGTYEFYSEVEDLVIALYIGDLEEPVKVINSIEASIKYTYTPVSEEGAEETPVELRVHYGKEYKGISILDRKKLMVKYTEPQEAP